MQPLAFGDAVRDLRERTDPVSVGLTPGGRRVPGLRREELGDLAGMSADYIRRLEQGRSHPSAGVVKAIARAVRARRADYQRLSALAGYAAADGQVPTELGPGATRLLERFPDIPMIVTDAAMNVVAANGVFVALEHWTASGDRWAWNVAWRQFCNPFDAFQQSETDAADHEAVLVTQLRDARLRYPSDTPLAEMIDEMRGRSRRFDDLWRTPRPASTYESSGTFTRSDGEPVTLAGNLIAIPGDDLAAVMLTAAPGSHDAARLAEVVSATTGPAVFIMGQSGP